MANFQSWIAAGHLARKPELRFTAKGKPVAETAIAINREWKTDDGEERREVTFVNLALFGKSAETFAKLTAKGTAILIEGRLRQEKWEDKETKKERSRIICVVESWQFCAPKTGDATAGPAKEAPEPSPESDEVPF